MNRLLRRLWGSLLGRNDERRLQEEIEEHLALQTQENMRAGFSPSEARRQAVLKFALEALREEYRDQQRLPLLETLFRNLRYAVRQFRKKPGLTTTRFGVGVIDFSALGLVTLVLLFAALSACYLPGRRAAAVDPHADASERITVGQPETEQIPRSTLHAQTSVVKGKLRHRVMLSIPGPQSTVARHGSSRNESVTQFNGMAFAVTS